MKGYDYSQPGAYFVTICTHGKQSIFGKIVDGEMKLNDFGKVVEFTWNDLVNHVDGIELGPFVIMPNHIHGIIHIIAPANTVGAGSDINTSVGAGSGINASVGAGSGINASVGAGSEPARTEPARTEPARTEPARTEPARTEPARTEPAPTEPARTEPARTEPARTEPARTEPARTEPARTEPARTEPTRTEPARTEPAHTEPARTEPTRTEPTRTEPARTSARKQTPLSEIVRQLKTFSAKRINLLRKSTGKPVWQRNYYEHIIRNNESYQKIGDYILTNPIQWENDRYYSGGTP
jgi:REP element-mobilizing transposase RayT